MFYVVISEKGGSQKRLEFDKKEITIGRVQGNDIILPKGNVSKRHSRIVLKDGKFIIVDLKSTNGTFVNGRKISSPQVVGGADRIYIGDFTISVEKGDGSEGFAGEEGGAPPPMPMEEPLPPLDVEPEEQPSPPPAAMGARPPFNPPVANPTPRPPVPEPKRPSPPPAVRAIPNPEVAVSNAPRMPSGKLTNGSGIPNKSGVQAVAVGTSAANRSAPQPPQAPVAQPERGNAPKANQPRPVVVAAMQPPKRQALFEPPIPDNHPRAAMLRARAALLEKYAEVADITIPGKRGKPTPQAQDAAKKKLTELCRGLGKLPAGVEQNRLIDEACQEALSIGPLSVLLQDPGVFEIFVNGPHQILTTREGGVQSEEVAFATELGLLCATDRLLQGAGRSLPLGASSIDTRLLDGTHLVASFPPLSARGTTLLLRKGPPPQNSLAGLVAQGVLPENAAAFLEICVRGRLSVLVSGPSGSGRGSLLQALASLSSPEERLGVLFGGAPFSVEHPQSFLLSQRLLPQALRLGASRLVIRDLSPEATFDVVTALHNRVDGGLVSCIGQSTQDALERVAIYAQLGAPVASADSLREMVGRVFPVVVNLVRFPDGTKRVVQISEAGVVVGPDGIPTMASSDLYLWDNERLVSTRQVPQFWGMLEARGEANGTAPFE